MRVQTSNQNLMQGEGESSTYTINFNGSMASILSDKLYENKVAAPIREILANAYDAYVDTQEIIPPHVDLPTLQSPVMRIKDFGVGMDRQGMITRFCTYGGTDKGDSNLSIGGMGIGCKSPFAYTDTFTVTSVKDGHKCTLICFKNQSGVPDYKFVYDGPANGEDKSPKGDALERSGTTVEWAVRREDINRANAEFLNVALRFDVRPKAYKNGVPHNYTSLVEDGLYTTKSSDDGKSWAIRSDEFNQVVSSVNSAHAFVVMGNIAYPIDRDAIDSTYRDFCSENVDIFCPIGSVGVSASREGISYDDLSVAYLNKRIKMFADECIVEFQKTLDSKTTWYEACKYYQNVTGQDSYSYHRTSVQKYAQRVLKWKVTGEAPTDHNIDPLKQGRKHRKSVTYPDGTSGFQPITPSEYGFGAVRTKKYSWGNSGPLYSNTAITKTINDNLQRGPYAYRNCRTAFEGRDTLVLYIPENIKKLNSAFLQYVEAHPNDTTYCVVVYGKAVLDGLLTNGVIKSTDYITLDEAFVEKWYVKPVRAKKAANLAAIDPTSVYPPTVSELTFTDRGYYNEPESVWSENTSTMKFVTWEASLGDDTRWYTVSENKEVLNFRALNFDSKEIKVAQIFKDIKIYVLPKSNVSRIKGWSKWKCIEDNKDEFEKLIKHSIDIKVYEKLCVDYKIMDDIVLGPLANKRLRSAIFPILQHPMWRLIFSKCDAYDENKCKYNKFRVVQYDGFQKLDTNLVTNKVAPQRDKIKKFLDNYPMIKYLDNYQTNSYIANDVDEAARQIARYLNN